MGRRVGVFGAPALLHCLLEFFLMVLVERDRAVDLRIRGSWGTPASSVSASVRSGSGPVDGAGPSRHYQGKSGNLGARLARPQSTGPLIAD